jgi:hypothetical protein
MQVLDAKTFAGTHDGTGIVRLEYVLENDLDPACAQGEDTSHALSPVRGDKLEEVCDQRLALGRIGLRGLVQ